MEPHPPVLSSLPLAHRRPRQKQPRSASLKQRKLERLIIGGGHQSLPFILESASECPLAASSEVPPLQ